MVDNKTKAVETALLTPTEQKKFDAIEKVREINSSFFTQFGDFVKDYGVVGLAIGIVIGSQVSKFVNSFVDDIISPLLGLIFSQKSLTEFKLGTFKVGDFLTNFIQLIIVLTIMFFTVQYVLKFFKLVEDKKKEEQGK